MKVHVVIERIVLDRLPVPAPDGVTLADALAERLGALLLAAPPGPGLATIGTASVRGRPVRLTDGDLALRVDDLAASLHEVLVGDQASALPPSPGTGRAR